MYLFYIDESGNEGDPADRYFVLGGAAVHEQVTYFLSEAIDKVQQKHFPGSPPIPFHGSPIKSGRDFWRKVPEAKRAEVLYDLGMAIAMAGKGMVLFTAAIEKSDRLHGENAVERATEEICRRFDLFLRRKYNEEGDPQRGLLIFSEGRFHQRARLWVQGFRELGTRAGALYNLADIPYFASMKETRLLQVADIVTYATFLLYERHDASLIRLFIDRFDRKDGIYHGLFHLRRDNATACECPGCVSRVTPGSKGPWL